MEMKLLYEPESDSKIMRLLPITPAESSELKSYFKDADQDGRELVEVDLVRKGAEFTMCAHYRDDFKPDNMALLAEVEERSRRKDLSNFKPEEFDSEPER